MPNKTIETRRFLQHMIGDNPKVSFWKLTSKTIKKKDGRPDNLPIYNKVNAFNSMLYDPSTQEIILKGGIPISNKNNMQRLDNLYHFFSKNLQKIEDSGNGGRRLLRNVNNALHNGQKLQICIGKVGWSLNPNNRIILDNKNILGHKVIVDTNNSILSLDISRDFLEKPVLADNQIQSLNITSANGFIKRKGLIPTNITNIRVVKSDQESMPFHIALAHELNHFLHKVDGSNKGRLRSQEKINDNSRVGDAKNLWDNEEEHRNVFSPIDPSSELNLRIEQKLPLRYPYASQSAFIEPVKTVIRSAIRSENPITDTNLNKVSSWELLGKLKGLMDKIDELPQTPVLNSGLGVLHRANTYGSNPTINPRDIEHTKIKLLPYLFGEDYSSIPDGQKEQILESYTKHIREKKKNTNLREEQKNEKTPWLNHGYYRGLIPFFGGLLQKKEQFNQMMSHIKSEQDRKILRDSNEQQDNRLGKYSFIPRMLAQEIKKGNVQVKENSRRRVARNIDPHINPNRDESGLVRLFTGQMSKLIGLYPRD